MPWFAIIAALMPLLEMLIRWLNTRESLTTRQQEKLNNVIYKTNVIRQKACAMGCDPNGMDDITFNLTMAAGEADDALTNGTKQ